MRYAQPKNHRLRREKEDSQSKTHRTTRRLGSAI
jgi:hypothetical protein